MTDTKNKMVNEEEIINGEQPKKIIKMERKPKEPKEPKEPKKRGRKPLSEEEKAVKKEQRNEYMREKYRLVYGPVRDRTKRVTCLCGEEVLESSAARHRKSNKCINKCRQINQLESAD